MLLGAYTELIRKFPSGCASLYGEELQGKSGVWLAVDERSFPSLLFSCLPSDTRNDIELRFVGVQFARECEIGVDGGGYANGTFSIVRLEENDPDLVRVFLRLLEETFCGDALTPLTNREISERILELANLLPTQTLSKRPSWTMGRIADYFTSCRSCGGSPALVYGSKREI